MNRNTVGVLQEAEKYQGPELATDAILFRVRRPHLILVDSVVGLE